MLGIIFAMVAGVMVFLAIDTLLPTAKNSARGHLTVYGVIAGMAVMAASLVLLQLELVFALLATRSNNRRASPECSSQTNDQDDHPSR